MNYYKYHKISESETPMSLFVYVELIIPTHGQNKTRLFLVSSVTMRKKSATCVYISQFILDQYSDNANFKMSSRHLKSRFRTLYRKIWQI